MSISPVDTHATSVFDCKGGCKRQKLPARGALLIKPEVPVPPAVGVVDDPLNPCQMFCRCVPAVLEFFFAWNLYTARGRAYLPQLHNRQLGWRDGKGWQAAATARRL